MVWFFGFLLKSFYHFSSVAKRFLFIPNLTWNDVKRNVTILDIRIMRKTRKQDQNYIYTHVINWCKICEWYVVCVWLWPQLTVSHSLHCVQLAFKVMALKKFKKKPRKPTKKSHTFVPIYSERRTHQRILIMLTAQFPMKARLKSCFSFFSYLFRSINIKREKNNCKYNCVLKLSASITFDPGPNLKWTIVRMETDRW